MTRRRRAQPPPEPPKPRPEPVAGRGVWLVKGGIVTGIVWLKRPMPNGQWPPDQNLPRDDTWSWWVRSSCGHRGGIRQAAFYEERYADIYEHVFRANPCRWTRCPEYRMRTAGQQ